MAENPGPSLSRDQVLDCAVELADEVGIEALTIRKLAKVIGTPLSERGFGGVAAKYPVRDLNPRRLRCLVNHQGELRRS